MKKLVSLLLVLALGLSPALAATQDLFPAKNTYAGFADVPDGQWYTDAVKICFEAGLMNGTGGGNFTPAGIMSVAEAATIAARIRETVTGDPIPSATPAAGQTKQWYDDYVSYLTAAGVSVAMPTQPATRAQLFTYLTAAVPEDELTPINTITALPDTADAGVLRFYNAGILTGTDAYGTFNAAGSLSRAECAAMVARIIRPALRQHFTPQEKPQTGGGQSYQEEVDGTLAMMVNGKRITLSEFVAQMDALIFNADRNVYSQTGRRLDWNADYGVGDLSAFFVEQTQNSIVRSIVLEQQAKALGCGVNDLAGVLSPSPSREVLSSYAEGMEYLAAKHILLQTYDPYGGRVEYTDSSAQSLARQIIEALDAEPTMQQFENLMTTFNNDQGMQRFPEGYLFQSGEMVREFEDAVKGLSIGSYTAEPVKSVYGYHIILRLDPADLSELKSEYQDAVLDAMADYWMEASTVTVNQVMLDQLDVPSCYQVYLSLLSQAQGS